MPEGLLRAAMDEDPMGTGLSFAPYLKHVAQTQNMSALARDTGLNRGNLYEAFCQKTATPPSQRCLKVTNALGLRLRLESVESPQPVNARISQQESTST